MFGLLWLYPRKANIGWIWSNLLKVRVVMLEACSSDVLAEWSNRGYAVKQGYVQDKG